MNYNEYDSEFINNINNNAYNIKHIKDKYKEEKRKLLERLNEINEEQDRVYSYNKNKIDRNINIHIKHYRLLRKISEQNINQIEKCLETLKYKEIIDQTHEVIDSLNNKKNNHTYDYNEFENLLLSYISSTKKSFTKTYDEYCLNNNKEQYTIDYLCNSLYYYTMINNHSTIILDNICRFLDHEYKVINKQSRYVGTFDGLLKYDTTYNCECIDCRKKTSFKNYIPESRTINPGEDVDNYIKYISSLKYDTTKVKKYTLSKDYMSK